jgi:maleate cis-trans isomerase
LTPSPPHHLNLDICIQKAGKRTISRQEEIPIHGRRGRIGAIVPANNSVIEPEWWSVMPADVAVYATRILARGDLTPEAVRRMEEHVDRAVDELAATGVDVIAYCDMVTTFIMEAGWNESKVAEIEQRTRGPALSAWTALRDALSALNVRRFALGTPYPRAVHALAAPFFAERGYEIVDEATLDIVKMRDVPAVSEDRLLALVSGLRRDRAEAVVLLATDLPTFKSIATIERTLGLPVLTSNQTILWRALRSVKCNDPIPGLGRIFHA